MPCPNLSILLNRIRSMKTLALSLLLVGSIGATAVFAAAPSDAPAGTMGMCKDGTYSSSAEKKGACRGHKGVKDWYEEGAAAAKPTNTSATAPGSERAPVPPPSSMTKAPTPSSTGAMAGRTSGPPITQTAAGGGAGQVWANDTTKVYHCNGDKWYGKTKHGEYMSESDAKTKGFHADHGKACS